ncbi:MAG: LCP family protein, partial [Propionibacteriaceae bacterium]|nr:LCP family protein [Propionibacteriaceae bacterium]
MATSRTDRNGRASSSMTTAQPAEPYRSAAQARSEHLRVRRGLGRVLMTLILPGSAQLLSREKNVGRWAIRIWATIVLTILAWLLLLMINRTAAVVVVTFKPVTVLITAVLALGGIGWAGLIVHAWKLSNPIALSPRHRQGFGAITVALALLLSGTGLASAQVVNAQRDFIGSVFAGGGDTQVKQGRYNILLLGGDASAGRNGLCPDSIHVASVHAKTGQTVLFSLPRNLEDFSFPPYSPMSKLYPDKFTCPDHACLLNAVYTAAANTPGLYPGVKDPGAMATVDAVEWITGLDINYYALVDLDGFKALIDAVGGINLDIMKPVPVGGGSTAVGRYIEPGTNVHLNGQDALWFARSRHDSNDYERMARQKCVMNAMLNQLDPLTVTTKFTEIAGAGKQVLSSNVPTGEMDRLIELALKARQSKVRSVSFVPPRIYPGAPDCNVIRT